MRLLLALVATVGIGLSVPGSKAADACTVSPVTTPPVPGALLTPDCSWKLPDGTIIQRYGTLAETSPNGDPLTHNRADVESHHDEAPLAIIIPLSIIVPLAVLFVFSLIKPRGGGH